MRWGTSTTCVIRWKCSSDRRAPAPASATSQPPRNARADSPRGSKGRRGVPIARGTPPADCPLAVPRRVGGVVHRLGGSGRRIAGLVGGGCPRILCGIAGRPRRSRRIGGSILRGALGRAGGVGGGFLGRGGGVLGDVRRAGGGILGGVGRRLGGVLGRARGRRCSVTRCLGGVGRRVLGRLAGVVDLLPERLGRPLALVTAAADADEPHGTSQQP